MEQACLVCCCPKKPHTTHRVVGSRDPGVSIAPLSPEARASPRPSLGARSEPDARGQTMASPAAATRHPSPTVLASGPRYRHRVSATSRSSPGVIWRCNSAGGVESTRSYAVSMVSTPCFVPEEEPHILLGALGVFRGTRLTMDYLVLIDTKQCS